MGKTRRAREDAARLARLQRWLRWIITEPRGAEAALRAPGPGEPRPCQLRAIAEAAPLSRAERLGIYSEAYFARLLESLSADFPALKARVLSLDAASPGGAAPRRSEERFAGLIAGYLRAHPSRAADIGQAGRHLPAYLGHHPLGIRHPALVDLGRLEWRVLEAWRSPVEPPLGQNTLERIARADPARLRMVCDPSLRLERSAWRVDEFWRARDPAALRRRLASPRWIAIHRRGFAIEVRRLSDFDATLLRGSLRGRALGGILAALRGRGASAVDRPRELEGFISTWIQRGGIRDVI